MAEAEQVNPVAAPKLERVQFKKVNSYEVAAKEKVRSLNTTPTPHKVKIVARNDGSYDVISYKLIAASPKKETKVEAVDDGKTKNHGLTAKQRRANEKK